MGRRRGRCPFNHTACLAPAPITLRARSVEIENHAVLVVEIFSRDCCAVCTFCGDAAASAYTVGHDK